VPLGALLAGPLIAALSAPGSAFRALGTVIGLALAAAALVATFVPIRKSQFGTGEEAWQLSVFPAPYRPAKFTPRESLIPFGQRIAREVERYGVRPGDVITDSANTFPVMLAAKDQRAYIITSDRDFLQAASDPAGFGVRFILVADPAGGMYDALEATHPGLYNNGAGIADLMHEWSLGGNGGLHIRMYRVIDPRPRRS